MKIANVWGREILDSRGNPTVEAEIMLDCGITAEYSVPSGASTGKYEAVELRDGRGRYMGRGVTSAVKNINDIICPELVGMCVYNQTELDNRLIALDGTQNKARLGANAVLAVSVAAAKAAAKALGIPLYRYIGGTNAKIMPMPMMNILNGGAHADNNLDIQEFMIMPVGAKSYQEGLERCVTVFHTLKKLLHDKGQSTAVGDEGGFAPSLLNNEAALDFIMQAISAAGYDTQHDFKLAIDAASSEWYLDGSYHLPKAKTSYTKDELIGYWEILASRYPIVSIEDALAEEDWDGWQALTKRLGKKVQLVGDDLFVTNPKRLAVGIKKGAANALLVKLNQIGTLTETIDAVEMAQKAGYQAIISHRSGETTDTVIADLAVALNCGQIKTGAPSRGERVAKYNRLLRIEQELGIV